MDKGSSTIFHSGWAKAIILLPQEPQKYTTMQIIPDLFLIIDEYNQFDWKTQLVEVHKSK